MSKKFVFISAVALFSVLALTGQGCFLGSNGDARRDATKATKSLKRFLGIVSESELPAGTSGWLARVATVPLEDIAKDDFGQTKSDSNVLKNKKDTLTDPVTDKQIDVEITIYGSGGKNGTFKGSRAGQLVVKDAVRCKDIDEEFKTLTRATGLNLDNFRELYRKNKIIFGFYENEHVKWPVHLSCSKLQINFDLFSEDYIERTASIYNVPAYILLDRKE